MILAMMGAAALAAAAPPAPCNGVAQIVDPSADSHHINTDVTRAWFVRDSDGVVTVNVEVSALGPKIDHQENDRVLWRVYFTAEGKRRYVQATSPRSGAPSYEYGSGDGVSATREGATTGTLFPGAKGVVQVVVPPALAPEGAVLGGPVAVAAEASALRTQWFERAPGGDDPTDASERSTGSDWRVQSCGGGAPAPSGGSPSGGGGSAGGATGGIAGVGFAAASVRSGYAQLATLAGSVAPALGGVTVEILDESGAVRTRLTTDAAGRFAVKVRMHRDAALRARAGGLTSGPVQLVLVPRLRLAAPRRVAAGLRLEGTALPITRGTVALEQRSGGQWLEVGRAAVRGGRFTTVLRGIRRGTFRAVLERGEVTVRTKPRRPA